MNKPKKLECDIEWQENRESLTFAEFGLLVLMCHDMSQPGDREYMEALGLNSIDDSDTTTDKIFESLTAKGYMKKTGDLYEVNDFFKYYLNDVRAKEREAQAAKV